MESKYGLQKNLEKAFDYVKDATYLSSIEIINVLKKIAEEDLRNQYVVDANKLLSKIYTDIAVNAGMKKNKELQQKSEDLATIYAVKAASEPYKGEKFVRDTEEERQRRSPTEFKETKRVLDVKSQVTEKVLSARFEKAKSALQIKKSDGAMVDLARENYMPAIAKLAEFHEDQKHVRRALSLYGKALIMTACTQSPNEETEEVREEAVRYIGSIAIKNNHEYAPLAKFLLVFYEHLIINKPQNGIENADVLLYEFIENKNAQNYWLDNKLDAKDMIENYLAGVAQALNIRSTVLKNDIVAVRKEQLKEIQSVFELYPEKYMNRLEVKRDVTDRFLSGKIKEKDLYKAYDAVAIENAPPPYIPSDLGEEKVKDSKSSSSSSSSSSNVEVNNLLLNASAPRFSVVENKSEVSEPDETSDLPILAFEQLNPSAPPLERGEEQQIEGLNKEVEEHQTEGKDDSLLIKKSVFAENKKQEGEHADIPQGRERLDSIQPGLPPNKK